MQKALRIATIVALASLTFACGNTSVGTGPSPTPTPTVTTVTYQFSYNRVGALTNPDSRNSFVFISVYRDSDGTKVASCDQLTPTSPDSDKYQCQDKIILDVGTQYRIYVSDPAKAQVGCLCEIVWEKIMGQNQEVSRSKVLSDPHYGNYTVGLLTPNADGSFQ